MMNFGDPKPLRNDRRQVRAGSALRGVASLRSYRRGPPGRVSFIPFMMIATVFAGECTPAEVLQVLT